MADTPILVDKALSSLGKYNKQRILISGLLSLCTWSSTCYYIMGFAFLGENVPHHCKVPENGSTNGSLNRWLPKEVHDGVEIPSQCYKYSNTSRNISVTCGDEGWQYSWPENEVTIINEWDLVCSNGYLAEMSQTWFYVGSMLASLFASRLVDKYGRKWPFVSSEILLFIFGISSAFSPNITCFIILRMLSGLFQELAAASGFVLVCEMFPTSERPFAGTITMVNWCVAWFLLTLYAFLLRNWRHLQITIAAPFILCIGFIWIQPESVPWLVANNRSREAVKILRKMADNSSDIDGINCLLDITNEDIDELNEDTDLQEIKHNRKSNPIYKDSNGMGNSLLQMDKKTEIDKEKTTVKEMSTLYRSLQSRWAGCSAARQSKTTYTWAKLFRNKVLVINMLITSFAWFSNMVVYLCLSLMSVSLAGNKYVNFLLSGVVEIPAYTANAFLLTRYGRRIPLLISMVICGIVMIFGPFIPYETGFGVDLVPLIITLSMVAKFCITFSFGAIFVYVTELYPTNLRNAGYGICSFSGKVGGMLVPVVLFLSKVHIWLPGVICGILALVSGLLVWLLPETHEKPLAVTLDDIEAISRFSTKKKNSDKYIRQNSE